MNSNRNKGIRFYMQATDKKGIAIENAPIIDLENDIDFEGLRYSRAEGLNRKGKIKNMYSESFADSNRLRVYIPTPDKITRTATSVTFTFYIFGEKRYEVYDEFYDYLTSGFRAFWDTMRKKRLVFYAPNEYTPAEEMWYGTEPYLKLELTVQNIFGDTSDVQLPES